MKILGPVLIVFLTVFSFYCGHSLAIKQLNKKYGVIKENSQSGIAIYNLFVFSNILSLLDAHEDEKIKEIIAVEMTKSVRAANDGNKNVALHVDKGTIELICKKITELKIELKLSGC